jgi:hypothetical protein
MYDRCMICINCVCGDFIWTFMSGFISSEGPNPSYDAFDRKACFNYNSCM